MEVSFAKEGSVPAPTQVETIKPANNPVAAPVAEAESAPGVPATIPSVGVPAQANKLVLGDRLPSFKDVILPRINVVANTGDLCKTFTPGSLVHGQSAVLFVPPAIDPKTGNAVRQGTAPVAMYIVGIISDRFSEKVKGGIGGQIVDTEEQVRAAGGTLDYKEWELKESSGMRRFEPLTDILVAIERPEIVKDDDTVFNFTVGEKKFTIAAWAMKGAAFTSVMKQTLNPARLMGVLKQGFPTWSFHVTTRIKSFKTKKGVVDAWVPVWIPNQKTSPEVLNFIGEIVGSPA